ncbi:bile acid:sodium symporter [Tessaracoccus sp. MC1865]|uniref:bile acid:sodium symporter family protein n=1 Tax=Tessaracoccus sp. MC1865 TaxID=2760310 RepID=UPI0016015C39|nr:bile acid:sodium symporter family protein [Tessaracoccus sp. MC1865]MBB1484878.1 bile acid:sodium symporter [Tessaracoccus sp. MC1865]QTO38721.1 bile acid:sodium symporter [Tessaracoccus sp. MC1865]
MKLKLDLTMVAILASLALGLILPLEGGAAEVLDIVTKVAIFLLFFGYGARLSTEETVAGIRHWKLHLTILAITFVMYPLLAVPLVSVPEGWLSEPIKIGLIFLCLVPSTVQSSITFTSLAGGNIPAAMVSATASNVLGVVITPLLTVLFIQSSSGGSIGMQQIYNVMVQLLLPFILGQLSRFVTAGFMARHRKGLKYVDQGVIVLIVYGAFSDLRASGAWRTLGWVDVAWVLPVTMGLLAFTFWFTWHLAGKLGFNRPDSIAIMFCGTKKSLATGVPMAMVLFPTATVGVVVIPLMLYHQVQLLVSSVLANRLGRHRQEDGHA